MGSILVIGSVEVSALLKIEPAIEKDVMDSFGIPLNIWETGADELTGLRNP